MVRSLVSRQKLDFFVDDLVDARAADAKRLAHVVYVAPVKHALHFCRLNALVFVDVDSLPTKLMAYGVRKGAL